MTPWEQFVVYQREREHREREHRAVLVTTLERASHELHRYARPRRGEVHPSMTDALLASETPAVTATLWLLRTRLGWVSVYNQEPMLDDGGWTARGLIHPFSPTDARMLDFFSYLDMETPRRGLLSTVQQGRWHLTRASNPESDVFFFFEQAYVYSFCATFLRAAGVPQLPVGVPLYWSFPSLS